ETRVLLPPAERVLEPATQLDRSVHSERDIEFPVEIVYLFEKSHPEVDEHLHLAAEVHVEGGPTCPGTGNDVVDRCLCITALRKLRARGVEQLLTSEELLSLA